MTNLSVSQECVHTFQKAGVQDVRLVHDEADLLALAARTTKDASQVFVKIFACVAAVDLKKTSRKIIYNSEFANSRG